MLPVVEVDCLRCEPRVHTAGAQQPLQDSKCTASLRFDCNDDSHHAMPVAQSTLPAHNPQICRVFTSSPRIGGGVGWARETFAICQIAVVTQKRSSFGPRIVLLADFDMYVSCRTDLGVQILKNAAVGSILACVSYRLAFPPQKATIMYCHMLGNWPSRAPKKCTGEKNDNLTMAPVSRKNRERAEYGFGEYGFKHRTQ